MHVERVQPLDALLDCVRALEATPLPLLPRGPRIAVVTDSQWVTWSAWLSQTFVKADVEVFADAAEARIAPLENLSIGTKEVQGISVAESRRGALWPWVLALGLLVVLVEWWWYQRQIRL